MDLGASNILLLRLSFGSLDAVDIPVQRHPRQASDAFGSSDQLGSHALQPMAIKFTGASFSWEAQPQAVSPRSVCQGSAMLPMGRTGEGRRGSLVLRNIDLSIPAGKLAVVFGEVGAGVLCCLPVVKGVGEQTLYKAAELSMVWFIC